MKNANITNLNTSQPKRDYQKMKLWSNDELQKLNDLMQASTNKSGRITDCKYICSQFPDRTDHAVRTQIKVIKSRLRNQIPIKRKRNYKRRFDKKCKQLIHWIFELAHRNIGEALELLDTDDIALIQDKLDYIKEQTLNRKPAFMIVDTKDEETKDDYFDTIPELKVKIDQSSFDNLIMDSTPNIDKPQKDFPESIKRLDEESAEAEGELCQIFESIFEGKTSPIKDPSPDFKDLEDFLKSNNASDEILEWTESDDSILLDAYSMHAPCWEDINEEINECFRESSQERLQWLLKWAIKCYQENKISNIKALEHEIDHLKDSLDSLNIDQMDLDDLLEYFPILEFIINNKDTEHTPKDKEESKQDYDLQVPELNNDSQFLDTLFKEETPTSKPILTEDFGAELDKILSSSNTIEMEEEPRSP